MRRDVKAAISAAFLIALAGCPGDDGENAPTVWLGPDGSEIRVRLQEEEPRPW